MARYPDHTTPPVPMSDEQKFFFDIRGWILLPSVLTDSEIETMKAEAYVGAKRSYEGALQELLNQNIENSKALFQVILAPNHRP